MSIYHSKKFSSSKLHNFFLLCSIWVLRHCTNQYVPLHDEDFEDSFLLRLDWFSSYDEQ